MSFWCRYQAVVVNWYHSAFLLLFVLQTKGLVLTAVWIRASTSSQELYGSWDEGRVFSRITSFSRKPYFQWWEFDYYFNIWLISCALIMSCFVMCVTPKEQFVWKFSSMVGTLVLTWTLLLEKGIHSPPQCDPCQLHTLSFYCQKSIGVEISITDWFVWHVSSIFLCSFSPEQLKELM